MVAVKTKELKIIIDLEVLQALFVLLEGTAIETSLANKIHTSV